MQIDLSSWSFILSLCLPIFYLFQQTLVHLPQLLYLQGKLLLSPIKCSAVDWDSGGWLCVPAGCSSTILWSQHSLGESQVQPSLGNLVRSYHKIKSKKGWGCSKRAGCGPVPSAFKSSPTGKPVLAFTHPEPYSIHLLYCTHDAIEIFHAYVRWCIKWFPKP